MPASLNLSDCPPLFATPRTPGRKTHGARMALVAEALGTPFMPWQRYVADVIGEVDGNGNYVYREWCLTVPRQSGKTTLVLPKLVYRCLGPFGPRQRVVYTAQTRVKAREKWETEHVDALKRSVFSDLFRVRLASPEAIIWVNGSRHGVDAVTDKAGHGPTVDEFIIDEAFSQVDWAVEQAAKPSMITRKSAQLGILSTAGTEKSVYLRSKVDSGRSRVEAGTNKGIAYFEWSAPAGSDPDDPATWRACMPAVGHTVDIDAVAAERESMKAQPGEFERAFLNWWPNGRANVQAIPADAWDACRDGSVEIEGRFVWSIDTSPSRDWSAIAAAGYAPDGREVIDMGDYRQGTQWVVQRLTELAEKHNNWVVGVDAQGPAASLIPDLEAVRAPGGGFEGFTVVKAGQGDKAAACGALYDAAISVDDDGKANRLVHRDQAELDAALAAAGKSKLGDTWLWSRSNSLDDITPLYAVTIARWALTVTEDPWANVLDSIC